MKQPNKHLVKTVASLTSIGLLAPSCNFTPDTEYLTPDLMDKGLAAIDLEFTKEDVDYLQFIDKLGADIIKYPIIAKQFAKNPQLFCEKYGYNYPVDLDENFLRLILALGDDDINSAVKAGDIQTTLFLMKEKNLLNSNYYSKYQIDEEQRKELLAMMGFNDEFINEAYGCGVAVCLVIVLAVGYMYVAAVAAGYAAIVGSLYIGLRTNTETYIYNPNRSIILDNNPSLKIWGLKGNPQNTFVAVDILIEDETDKVVELLEKIHGKEQLKNLDLSKFKNFIKLNMSQLYK